MGRTGGLSSVDAWRSEQGSLLPSSSSTSRLLDIPPFHFAGTSPLQLELSEGWHLLKIVPTGSDCVERKILSLKLVV